MLKRVRSARTALLVVLATLSLAAGLTACREPREVPPPEQPTGTVILLDRISADGERVADRALVRFPQGHEVWYRVPVGVCQLGDAYPPCAS